MSMFHFNPPSPCGEGPERRNVPVTRAGISIHPPRAGRDGEALGDGQKANKISIHPPRAGRDLLRAGCPYHDPRISIHPPRAGRDTPNGPVLLDHQDFNPPSPCGEGRTFHAPARVLCQFQSTLPVRGGTISFLLLISLPLFQSTLPVRGGTSSGKKIVPSSVYFNPPSPCGEGHHADLPGHF